MVGVKRNQKTKHSYLFIYFLLKVKSQRSLQYVHRLVEKRARGWYPARKNLLLETVISPGISVFSMSAFCTCAAAHP